LRNILIFGVVEGPPPTTLTTTQILLLVRLGVIVTVIPVMSVQVPLGAAENVSVFVVL